jgi:hypothetical protein
MNENVIDNHDGKSSPFGSGYKKIVEGKKLRVLDFDDTIVQTKSKIYVTNQQTGKEFSLTPAQFALYNPRKGDKFDFSDFDKLISPQGIKKYNKVLQRLVKSSGDRKVVILTARASIKPVAQYLKSIGITSGVQMVGLADANPIKKKNYIEKMIKGGYDDIFFIDDSPKNIDAVNQLKRDYPEVIIKTQLAKMS